MSFKIEKITEPLLLGEGPHWDGDQQVLYLISIFENTIHRYTPSTGELTKAKLSGPVGFLVPVEGTRDQFLVGVGRKFQIVRWDGRDGSQPEVLRELEEVDQAKKYNRINDGKADPKGRVFAGTMHEEPPGNVEKNEGSLFRVDGAKVTKLAEGISISNGLAWDLKEKAFYYSDSLEENIRRYDYDVETGEISNLRYIFDFKKNGIQGVPDGTTIDSDGNLWVAVFDGSCVLHIDPRTGKLLKKIQMPVPKVTSVTFGGPNLDILFVTSASFKVTGNDAPLSGCTFMIKGLGVKGHPNVNYKL